MVCRPVMDEEEMAFCVVRDFSGTSQDLRVTLNAPPTMTGKEFVREVAKLFNFEPYSFRLVSPTPCKRDNIYQAVLTEDTEELLRDLGVNYETNSRNLFIVEGLNGSNPRLVSKDDDLELGASASPEEPSSSNSYSPPLPENTSAALVEDRKNHTTPVKTKSFKNESQVRPFESAYVIGYRGLINQAMTCYLNSLLQALYMTPEFRNALYSWKFVPAPGVDEYKSIPYQLQKLFLNLQTSPRTAVETTDLTRSFGWDSSEAWQQHDIQELCRVMFDALEQEFKGTEQADLINMLYQGKMIDYVKCLECGTEKSREDTFLDIPLPVRPFGSNVAYGSVEEALTAFVQPETLEENNQYFCERCNKKCNAHKGLKFTKFPYLLTLHLMRFDFDYNTMHRIKLSDKVVFPETLNLNNFISETSITSSMYKEEGSEGFPEEIAGSSSKCDDSSTTDSGSAIDDESCLTSSNDLNNVDYEQDVDEGIDVSNQHENEKNRNHSMDAGPYVYELFSIMVHSGSATGGHYYVYIKDFSTGEWISFNDQTVTAITNEDIDRSFGGYGPSRGYYSGVYSSSMNAYMLMYRQIDRERNVLPLKEHEFPPHIKALLKEMDEKAEYDKRMREKQKETCRIKVFVLHPTLNKMIDVKIECNASTTLKEVTEIAYKKFQLDHVVPLCLCRLVLYNSQYDTIEHCLEDKEIEKIGSLLGMLFSVRKNEMLMEIRKPDIPFSNYQPGAVPIKLYMVDIDQERIEGPIAMRTSLNVKLKIFRNELYDRFKQPRSHLLFIFLKTEMGAEKFLEDETSTLKNSTVLANSRIFICFKANTNISWCRIKLKSLIKRYLNTVKLNITLPDIKPEIFKRLSIPSLSEYTRNQKHEESLGTEKETYSINNTIGLLMTNNNGLLPLSLPPTPALNVEDSSVSENSSLATHTVLTGGHHSDQSASEDSSLTDSDRTIIGEVQEDCQMSSPGSSPHGCDILYTNDLLCEQEDNNTDTCNKLFNECDEDYHNDLNCDYYFKEISNTASFDRRRNLLIEVDKRMPINVFKKHLEQYVQAPSPYFKLCSDNFVQGDVDCASGMNITTLLFMEDGETVHVRYGRPSKPGSIKTRIYYLNFNETKKVKLLGEFDIDEECYVGETKKELLHDLRVIQNIEIPFEKCRLRKKVNDCPGTIYTNEQVWKNLNIGYNWELYLQILDKEEPVTDPQSQTCLMIRHYMPPNRYAKRITEIVVDDLTSENIKSKISEISGIPEENLILGDQMWSSAIRISTNPNSDIDWNAIMNAKTLDEWPVNLKEEGHVINYKDDRDEPNEVKTENKYIRSRAYKNERTLKIHLGPSRFSARSEIN